MEASARRGLRRAWLEFGQGETLVKALMSGCRISWAGEEEEEAGVTPRFPTGQPSGWGVVTIH